MQSAVNLMNIDDRLIPIIDRLTDAVNKCYAAENASDREREDDHCKCYAYTAGYSRSAMNGAIDDLSLIVEELRRGV